MRIMERLDQSELGGIGCTTQPVSKLPTELGQSSVIRESVHRSRKMILLDKFHGCASIIPMLKSLEMLDRDSTLEERVSDGYWDACYRDISSHLLSPTEIGCVDSGLSSLNTWSSKTVERSWFSTHMKSAPSVSSQRIFSQYFMSSLAGCTDLDVTVSRSRKIRIYPTEEQAQIFRQWIGVGRKVYNQTVEHLNKSESKGSWMGTAKDLLRELPDYCDSVPFQVKKVAVRDAYQSFSTNVKKVKKQGGKFDLKFKSRKNQVQSCFIPKSALKDKGVYHTLSGKLKYSESLPEDLCDSRLALDRGRWYIAVPYKKRLSASENQGRVVSIDPGIRSFISFFSEDSFGHVGYHDFGRIVRLCHYLDGLISRSTKVSAKQRRAMRKAAFRMRWKIRDLISELHHKATKFLTDNFDIIFLPKFETQQMSCKARRKLNRKSVRNMLTYSFYKFSEHLKNKCIETGKLLVRVNESYTSKINSFTGEVMKIGSKEYFEHDGIRINRDINGARNILCFALGDNPNVQQHVANVSKC